MIQVGDESYPFIGGQPTQLELVPDLFGGVGQQQGKGLGFGQLSALDKAGYGRGVQAGDSAKVEDDVAHLWLRCVGHPRPNLLQ